MVNFVKRLNLFLLSIMFSSIACKKNTVVLPVKISEKSELITKNDSIKNIYCFQNIFDSLKIVHSDKSVSNYLNITKKDLFKNQKIKKEYYKDIKQFYQNTFFSESYILTNQNKEYLILIGQSSGATGIGVDYWDYECYFLNDKNNEIQFSSLAKTPSSVFFDGYGELRYLVVDDNYPRPANGEEIKLKYYPVIGTLYDKEGKKINEINYNCYETR